MVRAGSRSLKAALREAGLGEAAPESGSRSRPADRRVAPRQGVRAAKPSFEPASFDDYDLARAAHEAKSPSLAMFEQQEPKPEALVQPHAPALHGPMHGSVVWPPPWVRAAQRGRRRARLLNTFGWMMTLVVAGSILGVASHYLAIGPSQFQSMQARQ